MRLLGLFAKAPRPGQAKTRLIPHLGATEAARVAEAFLRDTTRLFRNSGDTRWLCYSPAETDTEAWFRELGGGDWSTWPQPPGPLGERLAAYFHAGFAAGHRQVVALGADSPTLPLEYVERAFAELHHADCVLGPATDGGYYAVGLSRPLPKLFEEVDFGTERVLEQTVGRLIETGGTLATLPPWYDVDSPDDLAMLRGHLRALSLTGQGGNLPETARLFPPNTQTGDQLL